MAIEPVDTKTIFNSEAQQGTDRWAAHFKIGGIEKGGLNDARLTAASAAEESFRSNSNGHRGEESEEEKLKREVAQALAQGAWRHSQQMYESMRNTALSFTDSQIARFREELDTNKTDLNAAEARQGVIVEEKAALAAEAVVLEQRIDEVQSDLAVVTKAEVDTVAAIADTNAAIQLNAEVQDNGLRDSQGRLIVKDEIIGDSMSDRYTTYYVRDEKTGELISQYDLSPEERRELREIIKGAQAGQVIAHASDLLTPEQLAQKQQDAAADRQNLSELRERRQFLQTQVTELNEDLTDLREEIAGLDAESAENMEKIAALKESILLKEAQIKSAETLAQDIRDGKYKTPEEIDAAMQREFSTEWSTYHDNEQNRSMTQFLAAENKETFQEMRVLRQEITQLSREGSSDTPEITALQQRTNELKAELLEDANTRSRIMSNDYSPEELARMMEERYGPEWTEWQQKQAQSPQSVATQVYGEMPGTNTTTPAFNIASGVATPEPAPATPEVTPENTMDVAANNKKVFTMGTGTALG